MWGPQAVSDIQVQAGSYSGSGGASTICYGADFESIANGTNSGQIRIIGTAFRNDTTAAVRFFDCQACQVIGIKGEQVNASPAVGTAISIDGSSTSKCAEDQVVGGAFAHYTNPAISIGANCTDPLVVAVPGTGVTDSASGAPVELSANGVRPGQTATPSPEGTLSYDIGTHVPVWALGRLGVGRVATFSNGLTPATNDCVQWANTTQIGDFGKPCTPNNTMLTFYCTAGVTKGATVYIFPSATSGACTTTVAAMVPAAFSGTIKNLEAFYLAAPGTSHTDTFSVVVCPGRVCGLPSGVTCSIAGTATYCHDVTDTVSVSEGDGIQIIDVTDANSAASNARVTIQVQ